MLTDPVRHHHNGQAPMLNVGNSGRPWAILGDFGRLWVTNEVAPRTEGMYIFMLGNAIHVFNPFVQPRTSVWGN